MEDSALVLEMMKSTGEFLFGMKQSHRPMKALMHGEIFILEHLDRKNDTMTPGELSAIMGGSSARTAIALRNLEKKGYIKRDIDKADRRKILVSITGEGQTLAREERESVLTKMKQIIGELGEDDAREYIRIIGRITEITRKL